MTKSALHHSANFIAATHTNAPRRGTLRTPTPTHSSWWIVAGAVVVTLLATHFL